ncbi:MAG TPA: YwqJ-related putative deaminase [Cryptosporangiaceae bacterium]|nr:YwqJ-related putative deaminase [Cryptosporangiaceae bacterium]
MITSDEAEQLAAQWVAVRGPSVTARLDEFDLGWVVTAIPPAGERLPLGEGRGVIDRRTGEISVWPSLPIANVVALYRENHAQPPPPRAWDTLRQARRDLRRKPYPATVSYLTVSERVWTARSAKGDGELAHHPIVAAFFNVMPAKYRERGCERASEAIAISDALLAEDAGRLAAGRPPLTLAEARDEYFRGADIVTYRVREPGDPRGDQPCPASMPSMLLLGYLGFTLAGADPASPVGAEGGQS